MGLNRQDSDYGEAVLCICSMWGESAHLAGGLWQSLDGGVSWKCTIVSGEVGCQTEKLGHEVH